MYAGIPDGLIDIHVHKIMVLHISGSGAGKGTRGRTVLFWLFGTEHESHI